MNLEIGFITYALQRAPGGIGRYTQELLAGLRRARVDLTLFQAERLPGLLTVGQARIALTAWQRRLALVHDPVGVAPFLLTTARRVVTIHDVFPYVYPETSTQLDWLIHRLWLPKAVRKVDAVITVSQCSKTDMIRHLRVAAEDVMVIPEAASAAYRPMSPAEQSPVLARYGLDFPYLLYVGSIEPRKNLPRVLEAYARLRQECPSARSRKLVIAGARKWKFSPVFDTVQRLHLEPHVHFTGFVAEPDLPALYNGAEAFVFPSLYEGFGLPVLEAMACGAPVVTSNISSLPEVAGDAALLVDPQDVPAIAGAMRRILEDPVLAAQMRQRGLERAQEFSWERTARETVAVYERVLAR